MNTQPRFIPFSGYYVVSKCSEIIDPKVNSDYKYMANNENDTYVYTFNADNVQ